MLICLFVFFFCRLNSEVHCKNGQKLKEFIIRLSLLSTHLLLCLLFRSITTIFTTHNFRENDFNSKKTSQTGNVQLSSKLIE